MKRAVLNVILLGTVVFLTSCESESVKCNGDSEKLTLKSIFKDNLLEQKYALETAGVKDVEETLDVFFNKNVSLELIRTRKVDKGLKSCDCSATLKVEVPAQIRKIALNKIEQNQGRFRKETIGKLLSVKYNIEYSIQETSDGQFVAETQEVPDLIQIFATQYMISELYGNIKPFTLERNKKYKYVTGTEDCAYTFEFTVSNNEKEIKGVYSQDCISDMGAGKRSFKGKIKEGVVFGETDAKEFFEMEFIGETMLYTLKKQILDNGKEMNFKSHNQMEYQLVK